MQTPRQPDPAGASRWPPLVFVSAVALALLVAALACAPGQAGVATPTNTPGSPPQPASSGQTTNAVQARADSTLNVREGPGTDCPIVGSKNSGETFDVTVVTDRASDNWYKTEQPDGWIWEGNLTLLNDDSNLPRVNVTGCAPSAFCGDGTCNTGETCDSCEADCGPCVVAAVCGNGEVEEGEACDPPEAEPPDGAPGEEVCWCDDACQAVCKMIGGGAVVPVCGNGDVEPGEGCDPPEAPPPAPGPGETVCWCDVGCTTSCVSAGPALAVCGDGNVEGAEGCDPPEPEPADGLPGEVVCWCADNCQPVCKALGAGP